jgi:hypothetical protein
MICYVRNLVWLLPKLNKVLIPTTYRAKTHNSQFTMGVEIIMHLQTIISRTAELSKTWTNVMYVLQVSTKRKPGHLLTTCKVQPEKPS